MPIELVYKPCESTKYTSFFAPRWGDLHPGVDIAALKNLIWGDNLYATSDGTVKRVRPMHYSYGNYIVIEHEGYCDLYAHMQDYTVKEGQSVKAGDIVGHMGSTGHSTGAHLHYELRKCSYANFYKMGTVLGYENKPLYAIDPKSLIDNARSPAEIPIVTPTHELVARRCNLTPSVVVYLNKYTWSKELWEKLWKVIKNRRKMPLGAGNPKADLATAVAKECNIEGKTIQYIWGFSPNKEVVQKEIWIPLWWNMQ